MGGGDADQNIAEDVLAGHDVTAPLATAPEALPGLLPEALGPIGDRPVAAHAAEHGSGRNGQPNFRSWALLIQLSTLESVEAIERSPPQTARLPDRLHLNFAAIFLPGEARCRLARQLQPQFFNEQLGV